jgi:hypothetical protein
MGFSLYALFFIEEAFTYWILIPICFALLLFLIQRASLMYKQIKIPCTKNEFTMAFNKTMKERNWKSQVEKEGIYKATGPSRMSRKGQLITVEFKAGIVYANSICFPGPTTNPFDPITNRKNISELTKNIKQLTTSNKANAYSYSVTKSKIEN